MLRAEGIIERRQGTGTFVLRRKPVHRFDHIHGIAGAVSDRAVPVSVVEYVEMTPAPGPVAETLGLPPGTACVRACFSAWLGGSPFSVCISYLPPGHASRLTVGRFEGDYYEYLEACGVPVVSGDLVVEAVNADAWTAERLQIPVESAVMLFRRRLLDGHGRPVELGFVRCRGDHLALGVRLPRRQGGPC